MENFLNKLAEILEVDNVDMNNELSSFECWDSLTILSIIALTDESYKVILTSAEINDSKTIAELMELIKSKL